MSIVSDPDIDVDIDELVDDEVCPWRNEEVLRTLYCDEELHDRAIGAILGCSKTTVWTWRMRHGIETIGHKSAGGYPWHDTESDQASDESNGDEDEDYEGLKYMWNHEIVLDIAAEVGFDYDPDRTRQDQPAILLEDLKSILEYFDPEWKERISDDRSPGRMTRTELLGLIDRQIDPELETGSDTIVRGGLKTLHRVIVGGDE